MKLSKTSESTTLVVERIIDARPREIFRALTKESQLEQWFYPIKSGFTVEVEFDDSVGGSYKIDMIDPDGKVYVHKGEIRELIPNKKLSFTWNSHAVEDTLVTILLESIQQGTKITLIHEFKPSDKIKGHDEGWKELLENLNNLLTKPSIMAHDDSTLTVKRVIDADPETLFEALTDQDIMKKWFFASTEAGWSASVENDPKVGGRFKIDMHSPENTYSHEGEYKEIIPNKKIVFSWNSQAVSDTVVTITLAEVAGGTEVKLKHEFMPNAEQVKRHTQGWTQILENLAGVVVTQ